MGLSKEEQREKQRKYRKDNPLPKPANTYGNKKRPKKRKSKKQKRKEKALKQSYAPIEIISDDRQAKMIRKEAMADYPAYLKSPRWKAIRARCKSSPLFGVCLVHTCSETKIHLHHYDYSKLGTKAEANHLVPLCAKHHQEVHDLHKSKNYKIDLLKATMEIVNQ